MVADFWDMSAYIFEKERIEQEDLQSETEQTLSYSWLGSSKYQNFPHQNEIASKGEDGMFEGHDC